MRKIEFNKTKDTILKILCPECKHDTRHKVLQSVETKGQVEHNDDFWVDWESIYQILECQGCSTISFRRKSSNSEDRDIFEDLYPYRTEDTLSAKQFSNVPIKLKRIYREVIDCYNYEIYTLCAAGLRSIIEGICVKKKVAGGSVEVPLKDGKTKMERKTNLQGKIAGLSEKGILTKTHSEILHEHRYLGNEALHDLSCPSKEELALAIEIIEHILETVFEIPEIADKLHKKRTERTNSMRLLRPKR
jgi:hypothetical protein